MPHIINIDKTFYANIMHHDKIYDYYLNNCESKIVFKYNQ